jgi:uncharacterized tellurite resistance protein B-like protein
MISKIKDFFSARIQGVAASDQMPSEPPSIRLATAALLVEIMVTDNLLELEEEETIKQLLMRNFDLSLSASEELFELARREVSEATSLYQFTGLVNQYFSEAEKFNLLKQLWQVALSDGILDKYEESLIRKLADLLHIRHSQFTRAKSLAKKAL